MSPKLLCSALVAAVFVFGPSAASSKEESSEKKDDASGASDAAAPHEAPPEYVEVDVPFAPETNTIASKLPLPLQLTPANVGSVTAPLMLEQDDYTLSDALRNVSSLNIQAQGGVHDFFLIRGYDSVSGSLVLTDGAAEPEATWYPMYNVAGIEVLKGPSGFLYGTDPLAGVVNIVRKQPVPSSFTRFAVSAGSFATAEATVDWNQASKDGRKNFRLNGLAFGTDTWRDVGDSRQYAINPSFTWQISDDTQLNFNIEYVQADFSPDSGIPLVSGSLPDVPRDISYQTPFDFSEQDIARFQVDYETRLTDHIRLRNKFYYRGLDWNTEATLFGPVFSTPSGEFVSRRLTSLDDKQSFVGNQFEGVFRARTGPITHNLLTGVEVKRFTDDFDIGIVPSENPLTPGFPGIPPISIYDPVETAQPIEPFSFLSGKSENFVVAPYVTDQMTVSKKFQVLLAARYDNISRDDERQLAPSFDEDLSRDDGKVSPMVGLLWAPGPSLSLYANGSRSYAPAGVRVFGDDLEPEQSTGYEIGAKKRFLGQRVQTTFAVYQLDRENLAIPDDTVVTQQPADQRSRGFEVELAAEPVDGLHAFLAYAYTDAELTSFVPLVTVGFDPSTGQLIQVPVDRSGNTPAFVPRNLANLWVGKSFRGGLGVAGGARYIGQQYVSEDNQAEIDSAIVFDATVYYDFPKTRLSVSFKNLLNEDYEVRGFGSASVLPAQPFSVYAGIQYRM